MNNTMPYGLQFFIGYVNPAVIVFIMVVGLAWNLTLLFIFIRHKEMRTPANTMILNLAVSDILNLGIGVPHRLIFHYPLSTATSVSVCRFHTAVIVFLIWLSATSVMALTLQRFFCVTVALVEGSPYFPVTYVLAVWIIALMIDSPIFLWEGVYMFLCSDNKDGSAIRLLYFVYSFLICIFFPLLMLVLNLLTARKLKISTESVYCKQRPSPQQNARLRSARVVVSLAIVFVVTYMPLGIWILLTFCLNFDRHSVSMLVLETVAKWFLFTNSCFNPLALYLASGKFRRLFRRYLFCSQCAEDRQ